MIHIEKLSKRYGQNTVLEIEALDIPKGQRFGLVGNNGAGKTTLFSLILDLIKPTTGLVYSDGNPVNGSHAWKPYTGSFIDQDYLIGFLKPEEYFDFVGKLYGKNAADVEQALLPFHNLFNGEILGKKKLIRDLSKGNQKRVGLAAAFLGQPKVVVLDEPFANLDPSSQIKMKEIIQNAPEDKTFLISSHDLKHIAEICDRIVVLEKGKVVRDEITTPNTLQELEAFFGLTR